MASVRCLAGLLLVGPALVAAVSSVDVPGCLIRGWAFNNAFKDTDGEKVPPVQVDNVASCQASCQENGLCSDYGYFPESKDCYLGSVGGVLEESAGALAGHKDCGAVLDANGIPEVPTCLTSAPVLDAAGASTAWLVAKNTAEAMAAWNTGFQPQSMQCWPYFDAPCATVVAIEEMSKGWAGKCESLVKVELVTGTPTPQVTDAACVGGCALCEQHCISDTMCSGYQWHGDEGGCWKGLGSNCFETKSWELHIVAAKRFKRGEHRVLGNLIGKRISKGMLQVFDKANMDLAPDKELACQNACLSSRTCQFWQLSQSSGCYIEAVDTLRDDAWKSSPTPSEYSDEAVPYPLTWKADGTGLLVDDPDVVAGEFLQRTCATMLTTSAPTTAPTAAPPAAPLVPAAAPVVPAAASAVVPAAPAAGLVVPEAGVALAATVVTVPTTEAPGSSDFQWWAWVLIMLAVLGCIGAVGGFMWYKNKKKGGATDKKRSLKSAPARADRALATAPAAPSAGQPYAQPTTTTPQMMPMATPTYGYSMMPPTTQLVGGVNPNDTAAVDALFDRLDVGGAGVLTRANFEHAGLVQPSQLSMMASQIQQPQMQQQQGLY